MSGRERQASSWAARLATLLGAAHVGCRAQRRTEPEADAARPRGECAPHGSTPSKSGRTRLSTLGEAICEEIGARTIAEAIAPALDERVSGLHPYEVQKLCERYALEDYEPEEDTRRKILDSAYERGVKREQVLGVIAIELRDTLLERAERARCDDEAMEAFNAWR